MSLRHSHRSSDRDIRMHDPHAHAGVPPPPGAPSQPTPIPPQSAHPHSHPHSHSHGHSNSSHGHGSHNHGGGNHHSSHNHSHGVHVNGSVPSTPIGITTNGVVHHQQLVSPIVPPPSAVVGPQSAGGGSAGHPNGVVVAVAVHPAIQKLNKANEETWLLIGSVSEQMGDVEKALSAYEHALRHNPLSVPALSAVAGIARIRENYPRAIEYFQRVLSLQQDNGEVWSALGHCYLMQDDLQKAYSAYQQALYLLPNPKEDPKLWYGIGILYDRYGSLDHAEEAFASVLQMDQDFDKANEILFRLGIIYKQQGKYQESLECFDRILRNPPNPLAHADIWFQIGHVYEQQKDHMRAKDAYERVVADNPNHAKVLQQLGWLYHQDGSGFQNQELAIQYLTKSLETDSGDAQSWYLLGRAYMAGQKYNKAYEAYQQAVYRDGRNPTFWCSIGVLYFQINQYRDALDAYSRAIRINPYISEVWFDLGSLYESCNNQISDAIDAYARASELDPHNPVVTQRLALLRNAQATGGQLPAAPGPQDVHPTAYASAVGPPVTMPGSGPSGPPSGGNNVNGDGPPSLLMHPNSGPGRSIFARSDSRGPSSAEGGIPLPSPHATHQPPPGGPSSAAPFRGGPPPPIVLDESRRQNAHTTLAPMEVDRPPQGIHSRDSAGPGSFPPISRDANGARNGQGPLPGSSLLLHHPSQGPPPHHEPQYSREPSAYHTRSQRISSPGSPPPTLPPPQSSHRHHHPSSTDPHSFGSPYTANSTRPPPPGQSTMRSPANMYATSPYESSRPAMSPPPIDREREREREQRERERGRDRERDREREREREREEWERRSSIERGQRSRHGSRSGAPLTLTQVQGYTSSHDSPGSAHAVYDNRRGGGSPPPLSSTRGHSPSMIIPLPPPPQPHGGRRSDSFSTRAPPEPTQTPMQFVEMRQHPTVPSPAPSTRSRYPQDIEMSNASPQMTSADVPSSRRYDPRYDDQQAQRRDREQRDREREREMQRERVEPGSQRGSPEIRNNWIQSNHPGSLPPVGYIASAEQEPVRVIAPIPEVKDGRRRRGGGKDKDSDRSATPSQASVNGGPSEPARNSKEKKRRAAPRKTREENAASGSRVSGMAKSPGSPEPVSSVSASGSTGSGGRSGRPSPSAPASIPPSRVVDEDYDEGVADTLIKLAAYRAPNEAVPPIATGGSPVMNRSQPSPVTTVQRHGSHRSSVSSNTSRTPPLPTSAPSSGISGPSTASNNLKRPHSPDKPAEAPVETVKRTRIEILNRRPSPPAGRRTPAPSNSRPSPIPFRTQPSHSPDERQDIRSMHERTPSLTTAGIPSTLPLPPPPSAVVAPAPSNAAQTITLPPIATLSPTSSTGGAPSPRGEDDRMAVDRKNSISPPSSRNILADGKYSKSSSPSAARAGPSGSPPQRSPTVRTPPKDSSNSPRS